MKLSVGLLFANVIAADTCQGEISVGKAWPTELRECRVFTGTVRVSPDFQITRFSKLRVVKGNFIVEGWLPYTLSFLKVDTLTLSNIKEYTAKTYYDLVAKNIVIDNFAPKVTLQFFNLTLSSVAISNSNMIAITGIDASKLSHLTLKNNPNLKHFPFASLTEVTGHIKINQTPNLNITTTLAKLTKAESVSISDTTLDYLALPLVFVAKDLVLENNSMTTLGVRNLQEVKGKLTIHKNPNLKEIQTINRHLFNVQGVTITSPKPRIYTSKNQACTGDQIYSDARRKPGCVGELRITYLSLAAFQQCTVIYGNVLINRYSPDLTSSNLIEIWGNLTLQDVSSSISLPRLKSIHGTFKIKGTSNPRLNDLPALSLTNLEIVNTTSLETLAFETLEITGNFILHNTTLHSISAISSQTIQDIQLVNNPNLTSLTFPNLESANHIHIKDNLALSNITDMFPLIIQVHTNFSIVNTGAKHIFLTIDTVGKGFYVTNNLQLIRASFPYLIDTPSLTYLVSENPNLASSNQTVTFPRFKQFQPTPPKNDYSAFWWLIPGIAAIIAIAFLRNWAFST
ncbi:cell wall protein Ecm33 [Entomophthora muscae]|uniref:Cell wall protein Ecm33 n=1 Tax=Entomophthora muscae TaxID=34485 RepID=A0ACC2TY17_9FUNG|nr:cell wall protein Ecm33 [Entomophthora muscae]